MYFVSWYIHNKETNEWNATIVDKYAEFDAAKKEYHRQLSMYINDEQFDSVAVMLTDSLGNRIESDFWEAPEPEPNPEPEPDEEVE